MKCIGDPMTICPVCGAGGTFSFESRDRMYDKQETYCYYVCRKCRSEYQTPMPSGDQIASFYPDDYDQYVPLGEPHRPSHTKTAVLKYHYGYDHLPAPPFPYRLVSRAVAAVKYKDELPYIPDGRALDIGCGNGRFIRNMNAIGWNCEGVEFSLTAVNVCRQAGLKVFHGDLHQAGYESASFDLVTARHLIEHVPDPDALVAEISRILKPGGQVAIETPNNCSWGRKLFGKRWFANEVPRHLVLFNTASLTLLLSQHGFRLRHCETSASPKIILNSWDYVIGNRGVPSRKKKLYRFLARPFSFLAALIKKGDILFAVYEKT